MSAEIARTELVPQEKSRQYTFPDGATIRIENVTALTVSKSGNHRLETADGHKHIVASGWLHIDIDVENWTL